MDEGKQEKLKRDLETIFNEIGKIVENPTEDKINDISFFYRMGHGNYNNEVYEKFWGNFRLKYNLPEIRENFEDPYMLLYIVFEYCIKPYHLKLDIISFKKKYEVLSNVKKKLWNFIRFISNNWISIVSLLLMFGSFLIASTLEDKTTFLYDVLISIGMGFLVALIISAVNSSHKHRIRKRRNVLNKIINEFNYLMKAYEKVNKLLSNKIDDNPLFVKEFAVLNNILESFLSRTKNIRVLETIEAYHKLRAFEKEIFDYSSQVVRKPFDKYILDLTTEEEVAQLQLYVIQLGDLLSELELRIMDIEYTYIKDINKMEDKSL